MANSNQTYDIELNTDQMAFMRSMKEKYQTVDDSETSRVVIDYLITNHNVYDEAFGKTRCFKCE